MRKTSEKLSSAVKNKIWRNKWLNLDFPYLFNALCTSWPKSILFQGPESRFHTSILFQYRVTTLEKGWQLTRKSKKAQRPVGNSSLRALTANALGVLCEPCLGKRERLTKCGKWRWTRSSWTASWVGARRAAVVFRRCTGPPPTRVAGIGARNIPEGVWKEKRSSRYLDVSRSVSLTCPAVFSWRVPQCFPDVLCIVFLTCCALFAWRVPQCFPDVSRSISWRVVQCFPDVLCSVSLTCPAGVVRITFPDSDSATVPNILDADPDQNFTKFENPTPVQNPAIIDTTKIQQRFYLIQGIHTDSWIQQRFYLKIQQRFYLIRKRFYLIQATTQTPAIAENKKWLRIRVRQNSESRRLRLWQSRSVATFGVWQCFPRSRKRSLLYANQCLSYKWLKTRQQQSLQITNAEKISSKSANIGVDWWWHDCNDRFFEEVHVPSSLDTYTGWKLSPALPCRN